MKVRITDPETSIREFAKTEHISCLGANLDDNQPKYVWVGRIDKYEIPKLIEGKKKENPELLWFPAETIAKWLGIKVDEKDKDNGDICILFPSNNGIHLFMNFCFPAFTEGVEGNYVEVEIREKKTT